MILNIDALITGRLVGRQKGVVLLAVELELWQMPVPLHRFGEIFVNIFFVFGKVLDHFAVLVEKVSFLLLDLFCGAIDNLRQVLHQLLIVAEVVFRKFQCFFVNLQSLFKLYLLNKIPSSSVQTQLPSCDRQLPKLPISHHLFRCPLIPQYFCPEDSSGTHPEAEL